MSTQKSHPFLTGMAIGGIWAVLFHPLMVLLALFIAGTLAVILAFAFIVWAIVYWWLAIPLVALAICAIHEARKRK